MDFAGVVRRISRAYRPRKNVADLMEVTYRRARESVLGVDKNIFRPTIEFYRVAYDRDMTGQDAHQQALNKQEHKQAWFNAARESSSDQRRFYQEVHVYPFRQPYLKRFGGYRWYRNLVGHIARPSILEYGCGSAVLTEYLCRHFPECTYTVADIPSVTLEFVRWKKAQYELPYTILEIGEGRNGIPLRASYDLIICQDVLEHTPNPLDIVTAFARCLNPFGVLVMDFMNEPGGENLVEAVREREAVKSFLSETLMPIKAIDVPKGNDGLYVKRPA